MVGHRSVMIGLDPLSLWHRAAREPVAVHDAACVALRDGIARLHRYLDVHKRRGPLPPFHEDALRQADARALGLGPEPLSARLSADDRARLRSSLEALYRDGAPPDEPWVERQALCVLGYAREREDASWWEQVLSRPGASDSFASERRVWALAALAWRASIDPDGASEEALRSAMRHPRADVRATAAVYLLAAHRLSRRAAPMSTVSALFRLCNEDPALEPRAVARVLLEVDRIEVPWEQEDVVFVIGFARIDGARRALGEAPMRAMQTLSHVDSVVRALRGEGARTPFVVALAGSVRGAHFELCSSEGTGRRPGDVALGAIGLRSGDQLRHRSARGETALIVREVVRRSLDERLPWAGLREAIPLIETQVNGTRFHRAREALADLERDALVVLERERDNPHDDRAIAVISARGEKIGYVPRGRNRVLAALMDAGERARGTVLTAGLEKDLPLVWIKIDVDPSSPEARARAAG
jgi:hypothetical protein